MSLRKIIRTCGSFPNEESATTTLECTFKKFPRLSDAVKSLDAAVANPKGTQENSNTEGAD